ncbi:hypothetical protein Adt_27129 [Abeliophyllum distichum]|uniref:Uncharacterized protein n=1 Tax=Abeliophyllum distichum TaxID=126358 RepID=A0ABD1RT04_9LAMI
MEQRFTQVPLLLGVGHLAAYFSHGATLRASASLTGTWPPCRLFFSWSNASRKRLSHWDSANLQLAPPMEQRFTQVPLLLGLDHLAAYFSHGATLRASASLTETRPPCRLFFSWSNTSLKCLSYWDSATLQLALPME